MDGFLKLITTITGISVFFTVGGLTIDGIRQGDYTFPIFLIVVLLIIWMLQEPIKNMRVIRQKRIDEQRKKNQKMDEEPPVL
ncbi:MAG: hypothetical protein P8L91_05505 [Candidatus Marinimicrobia bacterium]|nr:hypothetical protein [Candidatus Neomarinimicrobiota bacterium]